MSSAIFLGDYITVKRKAKKKIELTKPKGPTLGANDAGLPETPPVTRTVMSTGMEGSCLGGIRQEWKEERLPVLCVDTTASNRLISLVMSGCALLCFHLRFI
eukprot:TRINITY_DN2007_c0_g1_i2.p1 TRINITY_DN2007_c0_g1~~TRINITY_DN2007_c0_g1_i2.p1  ORF type:complete len:102 (+),score=6.96 TRINITY_DN2007_c0_g1_i2:422-727(+)